MPIDTNLSCDAQVWVEARTGQEGGLSIEPAGQTMTAADAQGCRALFWGILYDREDLRSWTGAAADAGDARLALAAYLSGGESCFSRLRGVFALLIWDSRKHLFLAVRDHLGVHPLFYARTSDGFVLAPSISAVLRHPRVSGDLNRPALADHILQRWPVPDETSFEAVRRVPPASLLRAGSVGSSIVQYWDPLPLGREIDWIPEDELPRFHDLFLQAVRRCLSAGPPSIFLSGGLDSVSIATLAVGEGAAPPPLALSLNFPLDSEKAVQRAVAARLGLPQVLLNFDELMGSDGWFLAALKTSRNWPVPLLNGWMPAYLTLGAHARSAGRSTILTGVGGDEWMGVAPVLAADHIRHLEFRDWWRLFLAERRSLRISALRTFRNMAWDYGMRPLLGDAVRAIPGGKPLRRALTALRPRPLPSWVAPDTALRQELRRREEQAAEAAEKIRAGFSSHYFRYCRSYSDHLLPSWENEEYYEQGLRLGVRILHPFLDPDLIEFLYRTPPRFLNKGGREKGLLREALTGRFPDLGFDRQKKSYAIRFGSGLLLDQGARALEYTGGTPSLARLGVLDGPRAESALLAVLRRRSVRHVGHIWLVANVESWVAGREKASSPAVLKEEKL